MSASLLFLPVFFFTLTIASMLTSAQFNSPSSASSSSCPLNFTLLDEIKYIRDEINSPNITLRCTSLNQALHFVLVGYVANSGFFLVPDISAAACWTAFDTKLKDLGTTIDVRSQCNLTTAFIAWSSDTCNNITSVHNLTQVVPQSSLSEVSQQCANASIESLSLCTACTAAVFQTTFNYLTGNPTGSSINTCQDILSLYAASSSPNASRAAVAGCLFNIADFDTGTESNHLKYIYVGVGTAVSLLMVLGLLLFVYIRYRKRKMVEISKEAELSKENMAKSNCDLIWFTLNDIKEATDNFSRHNIVGIGGFGNVYKGNLPDGSEIAVKRFKNCSPAGDDEFFHEVEVISTVKHRNLVALIGCCVSKTDTAGYQRIIVYEYMPNGSLYDQLFIKKTAMDWPRRQNIALGIVRGLAYLHQEVQPAIIHRDIKACNILLDANWNARVADFGLAKFRPESASHVTTKVAGTRGYVAPEYVLYGQLTEKSDVYSFGIVLLELLTGKKILEVGLDSEGPLLITDWAWSLVKQGRVMDVIDPDMDNLGPPEVVERFVLLALLCAHPQVPLRPTLDKVLKIMENDQPLPVLPDRPIPYTVDITEIEHYKDSSSGSVFYSFNSHGSCSR